MAVPAASGGYQEFATSHNQGWRGFYGCFRCFLALSNELTTPRVVACPSDTFSVPAPNFTSFNNSNISYFVGLKAAFSRPNSVLSGDCNLTYEDVTLRFPRPHNVRRVFWTSELHQFKGNLLFSDAHVEEKNSQTLSTAFVQTSSDVGELALPKAPRAGSLGLPSASIPPCVVVPASRTEPAVLAPFPAPRQSCISRRPHLLHQLCDPLGLHQLHPTPRHQLPPRRDRAASRSRSSRKGGICRRPRLFVLSSFAWDHRGEAR
jgi:prepilin-type processing-associated H-X9-DG protein